LGSVDCRSGNRIRIQHHLYLFPVSAVRIPLPVGLYESWSVPFSVCWQCYRDLRSYLTLTFVPRLTNNVYAQIGMITLIGFGGEKRHPDREFAKER